MPVNCVKRCAILSVTFSGSPAEVLNTDLYTGRQIKERYSVAKAKRRSVLLIVENCPVPFDQRVWEEACTLRNAGYQVNIIAPRDQGQASRELLEGVDIHRHPVLPEGDGSFGYAMEYA